ncbi:hypothetical protein F5I97DRAFT_1933636 [Phlebopus sp. FC_14]|nr:hypothetical protein F5I97DRAFT_1933636 [Phlebopus sp. FC_14]
MPPVLTVCQSMLTFAAFCPAPSSLLSTQTHSDFYGFPSNPISIYRTGPVWPQPAGPQAQRVPREARPVCVHPIASVWYELGREIYEYFDSIELRWTSINPVRFAEAGKEPGPLYLWVGVMPGHDVELAFRESVFTRSVGPQLLSHIPSVNATADVRATIAPKAYSHFEGTGCLYLREGGEHDRVLLLTARHVVLPPSEYGNDAYARKTTSAPRRDKVLEATMSKIGHDAFMVAHYKRELEGLAEVEGEEEEITDARKEYTHNLARAEKAIRALTEFHSKTTRFWSIEGQRIIGHVHHAPQISVGTGEKCYTEDWAVVELHSEKFNNWEGFKGNVMYLGNKISAADFAFKMHPRPESRATFKYPLGGLMQLKDIVKESELRNPTMRDANGEPCLPVVKNGNTTLGRATGIESFVREYLDYGIRTTSMGIAIYPYSYRDGAFSAPGDSGSVIADANGRIVGILTGGSGQTDSTDVTYATPYYWVDARVKTVFPNAYLFPIAA